MREYRDYYEEKFLRSGGSMKACFWSFIWIVILLAVALLAGCRTQYVPVAETHTEHHWHTDTVRQVDSVLTEKTTLIREVDSATMAKYGISLKQMERAWLIETERLNREISRLQSRKSDTIHVVDSVPKIVVKEVERKQSLKDRLSTFVTDACTGVIIIVFLILLFRLIKGLRR